MLGIWRSHADYQKLMIERVNREFKRNPKAIQAFESAILKMYHLNLDNIKEDFIPRFSHTGKPSNQQPALFRSFILMSHFKVASIDEWVAHASATPLLCSLVGVLPAEYPAASTHRDFMLRLWTTGRPNRVKIRFSKPKGKHGKEKLPPKNPGIIKKLADKAFDGQTFKMIPERLYQAIFMKTAVIPSAVLGLLGDVNKIVASGDGTCIESNASSYGKRVCSCEGTCSCPRRFSDPDAMWGWDSYHERWFYGHTAYLLSVHNKNLKLDLPVYMRFVNASRNDGVSLIASLAHARYLYKDILHFDSLLADAAHDNYPTYHLLKHWGIKPFIDLNSRSDRPPKLQDVQLSKNHVPICPDGHEMINWGFDAARYRIKYRCPLVTGKIKSCPYNFCCNTSKYGKITYLRLAESLRLLTPVPRHSDEWVDTYKMRSAAERVNNRILTDYQLERPKRYGKTKLAFFAFCNAINVHLDAQVKFGSLTLPALSA